jgi:hypothetical protein
MFTRNTPAQNPFGGQSISARSALQEGSLDRKPTNGGLPFPIHTAVRSHHHRQHTTQVALLSPLLQDVETGGKSKKYFVGRICGYVKLWVILAHCSYIITQLCNGLYNLFKNAALGPKVKQRRADSTHTNREQSKKKLALPSFLSLWSLSLPLYLALIPMVEVARCATTSFVIACPSY